MAETTATAETSKDFGEGKTAVVGRWLAEIKAYEKTFDFWRQRAEHAIRMYRNQAAANPLDSSRIEPATRMNIFWSNIQSLQPALYSRPPQADITRTHKDRNPAARASAIILERAVRQELETGGFDDAMRAARDDYLLTARGQTWVRYVPTYGEETRDRIFLQSVDIENDIEGIGPLYEMDDGSPLPEGAEPQFDDDGRAYIEDGEPYKPVVSECVKIDHVPWGDFGHTPAPQWAKVNAVWKRELMTRDQLTERFGDEVGKKVNLGKYAMPNVAEDDIQNYGDVFKRAEVYEIWDKITRKVYWISPGYKDGPLDEADDPLKLDGFFPCPKPIYGTMTTDSLVPVTDYDEYRAQAEEIDKLSERIRVLTQALKVAGVYDSSLEGASNSLSQVLNSRDNVLVPVDNWAMFAEKGGLAGAISFLPIAEVAAAIKALTEIRNQAKQDLFEISGLSDLVRGQGAASETATAQRLKGQFVGMRMEDRQQAMARFARDVVRIVSEIIAEHFSPETLWDISGWEWTPEARSMDKAVEDARKKQEAAMQQAIAPQPNGGGQAAAPQGMGMGPMGDMTPNQAAPAPPPPNPMGVDFAGVAG